MEIASVTLRLRTQFLPAVHNSIKPPATFKERYYNLLLLIQYSSMVTLMSMLISVTMSLVTLFLNKWL